MTLSASERRTPFGNLAVILDGETVVSSGFMTITAAKARLGEEKILKTSSSWLDQVIDDYLDGDFAALMKVKVRQPGGPFAQAAWKAMRGIRAGAAISYAELADRAGSAAAVRAAGTACARNWVAPFVPCHRIIKTGGDLGQYGYGVAVKSALLRHEGFLKA